MSILARHREARARLFGEPRKDPDLIVVGTLAAFDATLVAKGLFVGSAPPAGPAVRDAGFSLLILCAQESEYEQHYRARGDRLDRLFDGMRIMRAPLDDQSPTHDRPNLGRPTAGELNTAQLAAAAAAATILEGGRVLVTCRMGRNRSAFVAALALRRLTGDQGARCRDRIRIAREPAITPYKVLTNPWFRDILGGLR